MLLRPGGGRAEAGRWAGGTVKEISRGQAERQDLGC